MKLGKLWPFQESAVLKIQNILTSHRACLVQVPTGHGKTFMVGEVLAQLYESGADKRDPFWNISLAPIIYVTAASVEEQSQRDLETYFGLGKDKVLVTSYSSLIAKFGEKFMKKVIDENTGDVLSFDWYPFIGPRTIVFDECHRLKNSQSSQTKMGNGVARDLKDCKFIFMSATPFTSPIEAEVIVRAIGLFEPGEGWLACATRLCDGCLPNTYDIYAMENFRKSLAPYTVKIPHIRTKYKNHVKYRLIDFENHEDRVAYKKAFEDYLKELSQCGREAKFGQKLKLVADNKFRERAEIIRAPYLAKEAAHLIKEGSQVTIACNFQTTISKIVTLLVHNYGISRDKISLVWGGGDKFTALKKEYSQAEIFEIFAAAIQNMETTPSGIVITKKVINEIHKQIKQKSMGLSEALQDETLRLGSQDKKERQREINKFQSGEADICIFTFKAGSVGLSLHHCEDFYITRPEEYKKVGEVWIATKEGSKVYCPRPRRGLSAPTWSAIEMIQAIGRPHRLTSMSDTFQEFIYFRGTVEQDVALVAAPKLESIATLTKMNESWMNLINESRKEEISRLGAEAFSNKNEIPEIVMDTINESGDEDNESDEEE